MSWKSASLALVACALVETGCEPGTVTFETPLVFAIPAGDLGLIDCLGGRAVDTYLIDVISYVGDPRPTMGMSACERCIRGGATCELLARTCLCSGPRTLLVDIAPALVGLRFRDIDPTEQICVRVILLERGGTGSLTGPADECAADVPECSTSSPIEPEQLRICSVSDLGAVNESEAPLVVRTFYCQGGDLIGPCASGP